MDTDKKGPGTELPWGGGGGSLGYQAGEPSKEMRKELLKRDQKNVVSWRRERKALKKEG